MQRHNLISEDSKVSNSPIDKIGARNILGRIDDSKSDEDIGSN